MKKKPVPKKYKPGPLAPKSLKEPVPLPLHRPLAATPLVAEFSYRKFARIAAKVPFTQREWAYLLHLSEKTLQRYAKDNKSFEGIYVDRILQIEALINQGLEAFRSGEAFYRWLKRDKKVLGHLLTFDSLHTAEGISLVTDEIGRILYGVYI